MNKLSQPFKALWAGLWGPVENQAGALHFYWLDVFRTLASVSILFWHYNHFYFISTFMAPLVDGPSLHPFYGAFSPLYRYGLSAVPFFWTLSGFIFTAVYLKSRPVSGKVFFVHRLARLYPLHLLTLVVVAALQAWSWHSTGHFQLYAHNDLYHFVLNLFMAGSWGLEKGASFNDPVWSVSVEVLIYACFFLALPWILKRGFQVAAGLAGFFVLMVLLKHGTRGLMRCGAFFFIGSLAFLVWNSFHRHSWGLFWGGLLGATLALGLAWVPGMSLKFINSEQQLALLFPSVVLLGAALDGILGGWGRRLRPLGDLSYGIYLWHVPVQITAILVMDGSGWGRRPAESPWFFCGFAAIVIALAWVSFRLFELPLRQWVKKTAL